MQKALVAISPTIKKDKYLKSFIDVIRLFQKQGVFSQTTLASILHSSLYGVPNSWFYKNETKYMGEAHQKILNTLDGEFDFDSIRVLSAVGSSNHYLSERLDKFARKINSDVLVIMSNEKEGRPRWLLGSFAESAVLTAKLPVWIIKPQLKLKNLAKKPRLVVALDKNLLYSQTQITTIIRLAETMRAHVDIVCVEPAPSYLVNRIFSSSKNTSTKSAPLLLKKLKSKGVSGSLHKLKEKGSVPETVVDFADKVKAWTIITIVEEKNITKRLLMGSVSRRILMLTKRPFLNISKK